MQVEWLALAGEQMLGIAPGRGKAGRIEFSFEFLGDPGWRNAEARQKGVEKVEGIDGRTQHRDPLSWGYCCQRSPEPLGSTRPKCRQMPAVATRPRGVRCR